MDNDNFWTRRTVSRRSALRGAALGMAGLAGAALIGCGGDDDDEAPAAAATTAAATAAAGAAATAAATQAAETSDIDTDGELVVARSQDRGSLDPQEVGGVANYINGRAHFGSVLVSHPVTNQFVPHLGSFEWVDANEAIIIRVHPGIIDHEGFPYLAEDLAWSMDRSAERGDYADRDDWTSARAQFWSDVESPQVVDDLTLRIPVINQNVALPGTTFSSIITHVTRRYIERVGDEQASVEPSGFGPFRFVSRIPDTEFHSTRYDDYFWDRSNAYGPWTSTYKDLTYLIRPEPISMVAAMRAGEVDFLPVIDAELAAEFEGEDDFEVLFISSGLGHAIQMNTHLATRPDGEPNPFLDLRVRQAANLAIDRQGYIDTLLTGKEGLLRGLSSLSGGFPVGDIEQFDPGFDLDKAKELMVQAGYADGFDVDLYHGSGYFAQSDDIALIAVQSLEKIGIRANLKTMPFADELPIIRDKTVWGMFYFGSSGTPEVQGNATAFWADDGFYNQSAIPGSSLQSLYDAQTAEFDQEARKELLKQAWIEHYTQAGWIFLHEQIATSVYNSKRLRWVPDGGADRLPRGPAEWEFQVLKT